MNNYSLFFLKSLFKIISFFIITPTLCQSAFENYQEFIIKEKKMKSVIENTENKSFMVSFGSFNIKRRASNFIEFSYVNNRYNIYGLIPSCGFFITDLGSYYICSSLQMYWPFGVSRLGFTPRFSIGYYNNGMGIDLGFPIEFRTSLTLTYRARVASYGLCFSHISNAHMGKRNPGLETIGVVIVF